MTIAQSKVSAQGQISVPLDVRKKLGIGPGSGLEWDEEDGKIVIRRAGGFTFEEIHRAVFGGRKLKPQSDAQLKEGIRIYIRKKHARD